MSNAKLRHDFGSNSRLIKGVCGFHPPHDTRFVSRVNRLLSSAGKNVQMDKWTRVDKRLKADGKEWKELGAAIDCTASQMGNWYKRGIPAKHYAAIAAFFGEPIEWVLGVSTTTSWPFDLVSRDDYESLPTPLKYQVQVRMQDEITKALESLASKQPKATKVQIKAA